MMDEAKLKPVVSCHVKNWREPTKGYTQETDLLAQEVPIALVYNGISHAVMLATPDDLEDFAVGFSLSEGIVSTLSQIYDLEVFEQSKGFQIEMTIASECLYRLKERRRALLGRTGCGLCGTESLDHAIIMPAPLKHMSALSVEQICAGFAQLEAKQALREQTGATHATGFMNVLGELEIVREDVGRHNALDKLIGALARQRKDVSQGAVLVSSRASYEMVQKCVSAGIPALAAASAATALAVEIAQKTHLFLIGHVRANRHTIYAEKHKV